MPILNLIIELKNGRVTSLTWSNSCYGGYVCSTELCIDTSIPSVSAE